jgi:hypothetical protein
VTARRGVEAGQGWRGRLRADWWGRLAGGGGLLLTWLAKSSKNSLVGTSYIVLYDDDE